MSGSGSGIDGSEKTRQFVGYVSTLQRRINGILVDGSYAWAQLDGNGQVVAETVWWPAIPAKAIQGAADFKARMANPAQRAQLPTTLAAAAAAAKSDPTGPGGEVVIHHPPATWPWQVGYTFDTRDDGGKVHKLDAEGQENEHPEGTPPESVTNAK
jgi:hypothetical protein